MNKQTLAALSNLVIKVVHEAPFSEGQPEIEDRGQSILVTWQTTELTHHSFTLSVDEVLAIESKHGHGAKALEAAQEMVAGKMLPAEVAIATAKSSRQANALFLEQRGFKQQVMACWMCEALGRFDAREGDRCPVPSCVGKMVPYVVTQPRMPGVGQASSQPADPSLVERLRSAAKNTLNPRKQNAPSKDRGQRSDREGGDGGDGPEGPAGVQEVRDDDPR